jgi:molybdopterin-guanine dinucleotide biosynthesis protein A
VTRAAGVVLAGGRSRRMGASKAWLDWHGTTMLDRVVRIVGRGVGGGAVVVVRAHGQDLPPLPVGTIVAEDAEEGRGPLAGLAAGLRRLAGEADVAFVAATDAALLHPALVGRVVASLGEDDDVAVPVWQGHPQPLTAAWRTELADAAERFLGEGPHGPTAFLGRCRVREVDEASLAMVDPDLASFRRIDDEAAYRAARALPQPAIVVDAEGRRIETAAATLEGAAAAVRIALGPTVTVRLNGAPIAPDAAYPLAAGDRVRFS